MANKLKWTKEQLSAIREHDKDVLVTASAGTGKTAVLSGRCVDILADVTKKLRPEISNLLVLTFTEAAAEEMRKRIGDELKKAWQEKRDQHVRHQMILLQAADIGTIHSFCKKIITENFYRLGIDPTFRVIDDDEQKLLKSEALDKTIDWAWEQSNLQQELAELLNARDLRIEDGFLSRIIRISNFLDGIVSAEHWLEKAAVLTGKINPFETDLGEKQKQIILEKLKGAAEQINFVKEFYFKQANGKNFDKYQNDILRPFEEFIELLEADKWDKFVEKLWAFEKPKVFKPKDVEDEHAEFVAEMIKEARDCVDDLKELAILNPDYLKYVGGGVMRQTRVIVELIRKFEEIYSQSKRAINSMDFADLEHYALKLLSKEGQLEPSETALGLRRKYRYIFVDEYQDINQVQKNILSLLSSGDNIFVVGDVKQSIYAFRGTTPEIFIKQLEEAGVSGAVGKFRVDLNANFRSDKRILDFVNSIFERIMTKEFAGIDYDESAKLKTNSELSSAKSADKGYAVELHILDEQEKKSSYENEDDEEENGEEFIADSQQRQAALIAKKIRKMVGADGGKAEFQIFDKSVEKFRDVEYRDIAILMRSPAERVKKYLEVLQAASVPISCKEAGGYFEATEISDMLCLLKILDNPQRDIEMAAVLRSPFLGVSDSELAKIRIFGKSSELVGGFYQYAIEYIREGEDAKIREKIRDAIYRLEQWRTLGRRGSLADLVWQIYRETNYLAFVSALPNGRGRRANLLKLHDRAIQFEDFASSRGLASLGRFIEFVEKMQSAGGDWASAEPQVEAENAVKIISVHKSKGLEFPVVFVAELNSRFNRKDFSDDCVFDSEYTLGLQVIDRKSNSRLKSLAHQVITQEKFSRILAEEMRILYVAMTRARERLILTGCESKKRCQSIIRRGYYIGQKAIPVWQLGKCNNHLEWIIYGLSSQKALHEAFETGIKFVSKDEEGFFCKVYNQQDLDELTEYVKQGKSAGGKAEELKASKADKKLVEKIREAINWEYEYRDAVELAAKWSVTELTHRDDENYRVDYSHALEKRPDAICKMDAGAVDVVDRLSIGSATHLVIAKLDLNKPVTRGEIEKTRDKLLQAGAMSGEVAEDLNIEAILKFFESKLGWEAINPENKCYREWPFSFAIDAAECIDDINSEKNLKVERKKEIIVVQGIIDMLIQTKDGLIVVDFKTDRVNQAQAKERAMVYKQQLNLYGEAANKILKDNVKGKWLYFLEAASAIEI